MPLRRRQSRGGSRAARQEDRAGPARGERHERTRRRRDSAEAPRAASRGPAGVWTRRPGPRRWAPRGRAVLDRGGHVDDDEVDCPARPRRPRRGGTPLRRGLHQSEYPWAGTLRCLDAWLAAGRLRTRPWPPTSASSTIKSGEWRAPRVRRGRASRPRLTWERSPGGGQARPFGTADLAAVPVGRISGIRLTARSPPAGAGSGRPRPAVSCSWPAHLAEHQE